MPKMKLEQWGWSNMEELLQCPVCLEPPYTGIVVQCRSGHHICSTCKLQLDECPLCKCSFGGTRNFVVEELMRNYLILKNTMLLTSITDEADGDNKKAKTLKTVLPPKEKINYSVTVDKGLFACRVENCDAKLPVCRLLNHIRTFHSDVLTEAKMTSTGDYSQCWEFKFDTLKPITRMCQAVFVSGIGMIFLNIEILRSGHLIVACQMGAKLPTCQKYRVTMRIFNEDRSSFYHTTPMYSSRECMINILFKNACLLLKRKDINAVLVDRMFNCSIEVRKVMENADVTVAVPNMPLIRAVHSQRLIKLAEEKRLLEINNKTRAKGGKNKPMPNGRTVIEMQIMNGASSSTIVVPTQTTARRRKGRR